MHKLKIVLMFVLLVPLMARASTQEYEATVVSGKGEQVVVRIDRLGYISAYYGREGREKQEGGVGRELPMARLTPTTTGARYFIDDVPAAREAFVSALQPGARLYVRGNRNKPQFFCLYSTPAYIIEGQSIRADANAGEMTVRTCIDRAYGGIYDDQAVQFDPQALVKLDGGSAAIADALVEGRHVRVLAPRRQIVTAIRPEARMDRAERREVYAMKLPGERQMWHHHGVGYLRGFEKGVAFRPGRPAAFGTDEIAGGPLAIHRVMALDDDDEPVQGYVTRIEGHEVTLSVTGVPTGLAADAQISDITVTVTDDAQISIDGQPGDGSKIASGYFLRMRPALPKGAVFVTSANQLAAPAMDASAPRPEPR
jgi:hypothetical protein